MTSNCSEEVLLLVGLDGAVRGRVSDASQNEPVAHLIVIKERAIGLVDLACSDLASAGGASARTARVRQVLRRRHMTRVLGKPGEGALLPDRPQATSWMPGNKLEQQYYVKGLAQCRPLRPCRGYRCRQGSQSWPRCRPRGSR